MQYGCIGYASGFLSIGSLGGDVLKATMDVRGCHRGGHTALGNPGGTDVQSRQDCSGCIGVARLFLIQKIRRIIDDADELSL
jgi:hypothetical protein